MEKVPLFFKHQLLLNVYHKAIKQHYVFILILDINKLKMEKLLLIINSSKMGPNVYISGLFINYKY